MPRHTVSIPPSSFELYIIDAQNPAFKPVDTSNLWISLCTTLDHAPVFANGNKNSNCINVPKYEVGFEMPTKKGIFAFVVTVNIEGQKCTSESSYSVLSVQPKWEFHILFDEFAGLQAEYMAASWSNDNTQEILFLKWKVEGSSSSSSLNANDIKILQSLQYNMKTLHDTVKNATDTRRAKILKTVSHLTTDKLHAERLKNYYTVPCCVLGPIGQVRVFSESFLSKSFSHLCKEMPDDCLLVDYEQASAINQQSCLLRPEYWMKILIYVSIETLVQIWQSCSDSSDSIADDPSPDKLRDAYDNYVQQFSVDAVHDVLFRTINEFISTHLAYVQDTNMTNVSGSAEHQQLRGDGSGESQLMGGINTRCSTYVRRQKNPGKSLLPHALQNDVDVDGDLRVGDCEDGAHAVAAILNFLKLSPLRDLKQHWHQFCALNHNADNVDNVEIAGCESLLFDFWTLMQTTSRESGACLGVASAANMKDASNTTFKQPPFATVLDQHKFLNDNISSNKIQGHCWCASGAINSINSGEIQKDCLVDYDDLSDIVVAKLTFPSHGETTSVTIDVSDLSDPDQQIHFSTNNNKFASQFSNLNHSTLRFSTAATIRNDIYAQFLRKNNSDILHAEGVQFSNTNDPSGFLQFWFCMGGWNIFTTDNTNMILSAPIPQWDKFKNIVVRQPCTENETHAIKILTQCDIAKYPHKSSCIVLPPRIAKRHGELGAIAVACKESCDIDANGAQWCDKLLTLRLNSMKSRQAVGCKIKDFYRTIYYFN